MLKDIVCLPTWFMTFIMWRFLPDTHVWKLFHDRPFSIRDWSTHATKLSVVLSLFAWYGLATIVLSILLFLDIL